MLVSMSTVSWMVRVCPGFLSKPDLVVSGGRARPICGQLPLAFSLDHCWGAFGQRRGKVGMTKPEDRIVTRRAPEAMARARLGVEAVVIRGGHNGDVAQPVDGATAIDEAACCT